MKRFVLYLVSLLSAIIVLALGVDALNVWLIRSSTGNSACKMERLYSHPELDEVAIVGSSRACGNFVPSVISPRCFNYGENGMGMNESMAILRVLRARGGDAPIILNVDPWGNFRESSVVDYRLAPQSGRLSLRERLPGIRFFGTLRENIISVVDARKSVSRVIDKGAKLLKMSRSPAEWKVINAKLQPVGFDGTDQDVRNLVALLESLAPRQVYVVVCPCSLRWMSLFSGRSDFEKLLSCLAALQNVRVLNFYGSQLFSGDDFVDPIHFNLEGARKFSILLHDRLAIP